MLVLREVVRLCTAHAALAELWSLCLETISTMACLAFNEVEVFFDLQRVVKGSPAEKIALSHGRPRLCGVIFQHLTSAVFRPHAMYTVAGVAFDPRDRNGESRGDSVSLSLSLNQEACWTRRIDRRECMSIAPVHWSQR